MFQNNIWLNSNYINITRTDNKRFTKYEKYDIIMLYIFKVCAERLCLMISTNIKVGTKDEIISVKKIIPIELINDIDEIGENEVTIINNDEEFDRLIKLCGKKAIQNDFDETELEKAKSFKFSKKFEEEMQKIIKNAGYIENKRKGLS